ncbi:MAG: UPF0149 family protein [Candidatus Eisenbacteria bacterium]
MEAPPNLDPETIQRLTTFLESPERPAGTLSYLGLRGYLFALANAPRILRPGDWLPLIFGPDGTNGTVWEDEETAQLVSAGIIAVWNDIVNVSETIGLDGSGQSDDFVGASEAVDSNDSGDADDPDDSGDLDDPDDSAATQRLLRSVFGQDPNEDVRRDWCVGFESGWDLVLPDWEDGLGDVEEEHLKWFDICQFCLRYFADPEARNEGSEVPDDELAEWIAQMEEIFPSAVRSYAELGRALYQMNVEAGEGQAAPAAKRPGRNDPCPCGSGKKYKKCCLN